MRPPTREKTPAAAPTITRLIQAAWTTWRPAATGSIPRRVSGADEMSPSENAVAPTSVEAARNAYEKLVTLPTPSCAEKRTRADSTPGARAARQRPARDGRAERRAEAARATRRRARPDGRGRTAGR